MTYPDRVPELRDEVSHLLNDAAGTVIAKYTVDNAVYLDVRGTEDRIYYRTPANNWKTTLAVEDIE